MAATNGSHRKVAKLLEQQRALCNDASERDSKGFAPLSLASLRGHAEAVALLLAAGADVAHGSEKGSTALMAAALEAQPQTVELLLRAGAAVAQKGACSCQRRSSSCCR